MRGKLYHIYYDDVIGFKLLDFRDEDYTTGEIKHIYSVVQSNIPKNIEGSSVVGYIHIPQNYSLKDWKDPIVTSTM